MRPINDAEFFRLTAFVRERYGINLEKKRTLVEARLSFVLEQRGYANYAAYLREVLADPEGAECRRMINRLSTNYTFFFREPRSFEYLTRHALPALERESAGPLFCWCAACASGEEAYSLSMALSRHVGGNGAPPDYRILASDINTDMLERAARGRYAESALPTIPAEYRRFVRRENGEIVMCRQVAEPIRFQRENLLTCAHTACMDVIFCRNVMIYFAPDERQRLTERLYAALKPGGYLFISGTESIDLKRRLFEHVEPAIYRKRGVAQ